MIKSTSVLVAAAMLAAFVSGCSLVDSSQSISDSISSPFKSSSNSSSSGEKNASYRDEVRDYTKGYVASGANAANFRDGLAKVAARHKVSNWESDPGTFTAVGEGLGKAGASRATVDGYKAALAGGNAANASAIDQGYNSTKK